MVWVHDGPSSYDSDYQSLKGFVECIFAMVRVFVRVHVFLITSTLLLTRAYRSFLRRHPYMLLRNRRLKDAGSQTLRVLYAVNSIKPFCRFILLVFPITATLFVYSCLSRSSPDVRLHL